MKKQAVKHYYKNGKVTFVEFVREMKDGDFIYHRHFKKYEDCLIVSIEGKATIEYTRAYGVEFKTESKRSKTLKFTGKEIDKAEYDSIIREWKYEVATAKENLSIENNGQINLGI